MKIHQASVFLYREHRREVRSLVDQADQQKHEPLAERVCEINSTASVALHVT